MNPIRDSMRSNELGFDVPVTDYDYLTRQQADRSAAAAEPSVPEKDLPDHFYKAKRLRANGARVCDLAKYFGKSRATIHRWLQAVDRDDSHRFRRRTPLDRIMELLDQCDHLEAESRRMMARSDDDRTRNLHGSEARRLMKLRIDLLRQLGLLAISDDPDPPPNSSRPSSETKASDKEGKENEFDSLYRQAVEKIMAHQPSAERVNEKRARTHAK